MFRLHHHLILHQSFKRIHNHQRHHLLHMEIYVNEPFASGGYQQVSQMQQQQQQRQHQQQQNRQQQQQQPQQPQRLFQNYSVSPQNQYQYSAYPNYNQLGYSNVQQSLANARNNSFSNYIYPVQTQQQQQQQQQQQFYPPPSQQQQQYIPPAATTPNTGLYANNNNHHHHHSNNSKICRSKEKETIG